MYYLCAYAHFNQNLVKNLVSSLPASCNASNISGMHYVSAGGDLCVCHYIVVALIPLVGLTLAATGHMGQMLGLVLYCILCIVCVLHCVLRNVRCEIFIEKKRRHLKNNLGNNDTFLWLADPSAINH